MTDVAFQDLLDDPTVMLGAPVRVTGRVFFVSECPPPGGSGSGCVLVGYLADPERRTLIAADLGQAIVLVEDGDRVSCPESSAPAGACGDWMANAVYTLDGELQLQVLGGRESELLQFDVATRSEPGI